MNIGWVSHYLCYCLFCSKDYTQITTSLTDHHIIDYFSSGAVSIATWAMLWSALIFGSLNLLKILRVSDSDEYIGKKKSKKSLCNVLPGLCKRYSTEERAL